LGLGPFDENEFVVIGLKRAVCAVRGRRDLRVPVRPFRAERDVLVKDRFGRVKAEAGRRALVLRAAGGFGAILTLAVALPDSDDDLALGEKDFDLDDFDLGDVDLFLGVDFLKLERVLDLAVVALFVLETLLVLVFVVVVVVVVVVDVVVDVDSSKEEEPAVINVSSASSTLSLAILLE
jgi:hypothetical protein